MKNVYFKKLNVVDLFSGVGGLSYGFSNNKNFNIILANDFDKEATEAYKINHKNVDVIWGDIANLDYKILEKYLNLGVDIVVGGPPCQSYSTLGNRLLDDRADLFKQYRRVISILKPKIFIYENVKGLLSMDRGTLFPKIQKEFIEIGYKLKFMVLNAADYGVPQVRERVILVGTLLDNNFAFPNTTHTNELTLFSNLKPHVTISDALSDLPRLKSGQRSELYSSEPKNDFQKFVRKNNKNLTEHESPKSNLKMVKIMEKLPDGGTKFDLPEEIRPKSGYGNTYAKMWWNRPAPTITRNFSCVSSSRCIHPIDSRALSIREGARLQSFPDDYAFCGPKTKKLLQIGNAVPPLLSIALAEQVLKFFKDNY
jgi:DNA (cytosine-5)-methyltransferase 1